MNTMMSYPMKFLSGAPSLKQARVTIIRLVNPSEVILEDWAINTYRDATEVITISLRSKFNENFTTKYSE